MEKRYTDVRVQRVKNIKCTVTLLSFIERTDAG